MNLNKAFIWGKKHYKRTFLRKIQIFEVDLDIQPSIVIFLGMIMILW